MHATCDNIDSFNQNYYERIAEKVSTRLKAYSNVQHFEIYCNGNRDTKIVFEENEIKEAIQKSSGGLGLRVIDSQGREGTTFSSDFSDSAIEITVAQAVKMLQAATPKPHFENLAFPSDSYYKISGIYDPDIENICPDQIGQLIEPIFQLKRRELAPHSLSGSFSSSIGTVYINNSNGINLWEKYTTVGCSNEISLKNNGIPSSGFDWQTVCSLKDLNIEQIANNCYSMAERGLKRQTISSGQYPIVLSPIAVASFLINPLTQAINAERIQNNMSFLENKLGSTIGSDLLTLIDDPHNHGKIGTESFDAEGIATHKLTIVENGILKEHYHNTLSASKAGIVSNAHASRGSYSNSIGIGNYNILMEPGNIPKEDMIQDIKKGIYFVYTGDSPNYVTGDFSGLIMTGYLIKDGEIGPALLETLMGINLMDVYDRITSVSKERTWIDEIYAPYVTIEKATISGRD
jgi:PmbA protein